jgi:hypothetical protein
VLQAAGGIGGLNPNNSGSSKLLTKEDASKVLVCALSSLSSLAFLSFLSYLSPLSFLSTQHTTHHNTQHDNT